jgi:Holliday junction resolvasome RuvABC endonuclease subunit
MSHTNRENIRILAVAPSSRGFGFAVLEGRETLVDWGVKSVTGDKNTQSLARVEGLITHYHPEVMVLQETATIRRSARIRELGQRIVVLAGSHNLRVVLVSREQVRRVFFDKGHGTKQALAEIVATRFPEELGARVPPKRQPWMSEDYRMDIFDAVSLALTFRHFRRKSTLVTSPK